MLIHERKTLMVPKFTSQSDMINFIRDIPDSANFAAMLKDDFGVDAPISAASYQKIYLWKYLVQGAFLGKDQSELMAYAAAGVEKLVKTLPHLKTKDEFATAASVVKTATSNVRRIGGRGKSSAAKEVDGTVKFLEHRKVWVGYAAGKIQCSKKTEQAAIDYIRIKFGF
jgi:hypothetical protein